MCDSGNDVRGRGRFCSDANDNHLEEGDHTSIILGELSWQSNPVPTITQRQTFCDILCRHSGDVG